MAQLEENMQKRFMTAFIEESHAHNYDVCVFSMFQKYQETELRNIGDSNIFSLIRFDRFDGVVILAETLLTPGLLEKLTERIREEFSGPVLMVDQESDVFDYILMDHYSPIVELMNHFIVDHEYTDIAFLGGKEGHPHSVQRLNGYLDAMKAHNLPIRQDRIYHGNFWFDSGKEFAKKLLEKPGDLPQAVMCANDYMAIGLATVLTENGYKIPEYISIAGYDSNAEGRNAPTPLTSADIPATQCGRLSFYKLHSAITGEEIPNLDLHADIFIGGSCGCRKYAPTYTKANRIEWKTDHSERSYYSDFNHITEDLLCQTSYEKFFEKLAVYSYQIRPFRNFWMCLNDGFLDPIRFIGDHAIRYGYSETMHMVVKCGTELPDQDAEAVNLSRSFDEKRILPELDEERKEPATFIFVPMFFEDKSFGYACISPTEDLTRFSETFRVWMRSVNQGIEAFYRQRALSTLIEQIKADQIRDKQTGLYNYRGFHDELKSLAARHIETGRSLAVIALDLDNLKGINESLNRNSGDAAIMALANFVSRNLLENEIGGRLSNDEFLIGMISSDCVKRYADLMKMIPDGGVIYRDAAGAEHRALVHHDMRLADLEEMPDLDFLINQTVNAKNHKKKEAQQLQSALAGMSEEMLKKCEVVGRILDEGKITFHFQPIINASDGNVYAYESLMRYEGAPALTPFEILQCAEHLGRLYDIQKITFNGTLDKIESRPGDFDGKKVFINSLPAYALTGADEEALYARFLNHTGQIVVEYTEGSELDDTALNRHKKFHQEMQIETALDDYGSGFSNVNNLIRYSPRYVKIDRQLISGIHANTQKQHFVKSIIAYAGKNDILALAEGVETMEELRTVISLGVDLIQGFYTGYPASDPIPAITEEVRSQIRRFHYNRENNALVVGNAF